ncbi:hypothetical protein [Xenorhabdus eapokensis]|uniref:T3SS effector EspK n=1 Tax=Xenorhabdus eapokensis TaxID=1873482 RepID=A0A1Q5TWI5_9GAMM|nr:hypothetical protein [Xenorhabdus eapokensis]OKP04539.1 T3SS effector EspK [Xenorhabdus eapokensis]
MPFYEPFTKKIKIGDLIYGLNSERIRYLKQYEQFKDVDPAKNINNFEYVYAFNNYRPIFIDHYVLPQEKPRLRGTSQEEKEEYRRRYFIWEFQSNNMKLAKNHPYQKSFTSYGDNHQKYNTAFSETLTKEGVGKLFSRKCKAGLSWITMSDGNNDIVKNNTIHFILDNIDMRYVTNKLNYRHDRSDVTAIELRWIYRNRENPNVQKKIQFWLNGHPTLPPWENEAGKKMWKLYTPNSEIEEAFNSNLPIDLYF